MSVAMKGGWMEFFEALKMKYLICVAISATMDGLPFEFFYSSSASSVRCCKGAHAKS